MLELIRTSEGEITRSQFRKAILVLFCLAVLLVGFYAVLIGVNSKMTWKTTAMAPFLAAIGGFGAISLVYFLYCVLIKRFRAMSQPARLINVWMGLIFFTPGLWLVDWQLTKLGMSPIWLSQAAPILLPVLKVLLLAFTVILIAMGFLGPDHKVKSGCCFPEQE